MIQPQHPHPDPGREQRIIDDVMGLLKLRSSVVVAGSDTLNPREQVKRWLQHTLNKAQRSSELPWWFATRSFTFSIYPGQDVFDIKNGIDRLLSIQSLHKLEKKSMDWIVQRRADAFQGNNSGEPRFYCDFGGRLHIYPAPDKTALLSVFYTVPLTCDIVPNEWETVLVDGVIGLYGRHFDSSGLLESAAEFERRFWAGLKHTRNNNNDSNRHYRRHRPSGRARLVTLSQALAEVAQGQPDSDNCPLLIPAYQADMGTVQILADNPKNNQRDTDIAQIPGDSQP